MNLRRYLIRALVLIVAAGVAYWKRDDLSQTGSEQKGPPSISKESSRSGKAELKDGPIPGIDAPLAKSESKTAPKTAPKAIPKVVPKAVEAASPSKLGVWDKMQGAQIVENKGNDGDSFHVQAGGRDFELRLYFVDTPESYLSDRYEKQRERVEDQSHDLGDLTLEQTVELGQEAKAFTKELLEAGSFTVYTYWEPVYEGDRYYAFVELSDGSDLASRIVEKGLGRIHTKGPGTKEKPVLTPRGQSYYQARDQLLALERKAKDAKLGAWGL